MVKPPKEKKPVEHERNGWQRKANATSSGMEPAAVTREGRSAAQDAQGGTTGALTRRVEWSGSWWWRHARSAQPERGSEIGREKQRDVVISDGEFVGVRRRWRKMMFQGSLACEQGCVSMAVERHQLSALQLWLSVGTRLRIIAKMNTNSCQPVNTNSRAS